MNYDVTTPMAHRLYVFLPSILIKMMNFSIVVAYDKLVMFDFGAHANIDGASHYLLWVKVAFNGKKTLFVRYKKIIDKFWPPLHKTNDFAG